MGRLQNPPLSVKARQQSCFMELSFSPFTSYLITCMALRRLGTLNYIHRVHIPECEYSVIGDLNANQLKVVILLGFVLQWDLCRSVQDKLIILFSQFMWYFMME